MRMTGSVAKTNYALEQAIRDVDLETGVFTPDQSFKSLNFCLTCVTIYNHRQCSIFSEDHQTHKTISLANKDLETVKKLYWISIQVKEGVGELKRCQALLNVFKDVTQTLQDLCDGVKTEFNKDPHKSLTNIKENCEKLLGGEPSYSQPEIFNSLLTLRKVQVDIGENLFKVAQVHGSRQLRVLITDNVLDEMKKDASEGKYIGPSAASVEKLTSAQHNFQDLQDDSVLLGQPLPNVALGKRSPSAR